MNTPLKQPKSLNLYGQKPFIYTPSPLRFVYGGKDIGDHLVKHNDTDAIFLQEVPALDELLNWNASNNVNCVHLKWVEITH